MRAILEELTLRYLFSNLIQLISAQRMTPLRSAEYIKQAFAHHANVKVTVVDSDEKLRAEYPLLHAVARASTVGMLDFCV